MLGARFRGLHYGLRIHSTDLKQLMFRDFKGQRNHMDGIYRIVALRGGVDSVRATMPLIYWRVIW
jgi:hypothetical protein